MSALNVKFKNIFSSSVLPYPYCDCPDKRGQGKCGAGTIIEGLYCVSDAPIKDGDFMYIVDDNGNVFIERCPKFLGITYVEKCRIEATSIVGFNLPLIPKGTDTGGGMIKVSGGKPVVNNQNEIILL